MATPCDLVFEGGGAKGVVFLGALQALEAKGFQPRRLVGTSAGAITATLLAAGYSAESLGPVVREKTDEGKPRFSTFLDPPMNFSDAAIQNSDLLTLFQRVSLSDALSRGPISIPGALTGLEKTFRQDVVTQLLKLAPVRTLFSFVERGGFYAGDQFLGWIREKLDAAKAGWGDSTLAELHAATGRDLSLVASDTTGDEMLVLNHRTAPDCPTGWAVRMSMSIPFLWQEVRWDPAWGAYLGKDITGHTVVDGGVLSNFPLALLTAATTETAVMGVPPDAVRVFGLMIDGQLPVPGADADGAPVRTTEQAQVMNLKTVQRVRRLVDTLTEAHDNEAIAAHPDLVCRLPAQGYGTTEFDMSEARTEALIRAGRASMVAHLQKLG